MLPKQCLEVNFPTQFAARAPKEDEINQDTIKQ